MFVRCVEHAVVKVTNLSALCGDLRRDVELDAVQRLVGRQVDEGRLHLRRQLSSKILSSNWPLILRYFASIITSLHDNTMLVLLRYGPVSQCLWTLRNLSLFPFGRRDRYNVWFLCNFLQDFSHANRSCFRIFRLVWDMPVLFMAWSESLARCELSFRDTYLCCLCFLWVWIGL